jgi:hypothetical protein
LPLPTVYALCFHNAPGLLTLAGRKNKAKTMQWMIHLLQFPEQYFISDLVAQALWRGERRESKKGFEYCTIKRRFLEQLIAGGEIVRQGNTHDVYRYYGIEPHRLVMRSPSTHLPGVLLDVERDKATLNFLRTKGVYV